MVVASPTITKIEWRELLLEKTAISFLMIPRETCDIAYTVPQNSGGQYSFVSCHAFEVPEQGTVQKLDLT